MFEVLGENNKEEEVEATLVEGQDTLDRADNIDNADNANLDITFSCDLCYDRCQTLEEMEMTSWTTSNGTTRPALSASSTE